MQLLTTSNDYSLSFLVDRPRRIEVFTVINSFQSTSEVPTHECIDENKLTEMCMTISHDAFAKIWENEDDARWKSFLKD